MLSYSAHVITEKHTVPILHFSSSLCRWFWMCVVVLVFCLSLQSRQEPPEFMPLNPAPWPSIHRSADLRNLLFSISRIIEALFSSCNSTTNTIFQQRANIQSSKCSNFCVCWPWKSLKRKSSNPLMCTHTPSTYITCRAWHSGELMDCGKIWPWLQQGAERKAALVSDRCLVILLMNISIVSYSAVLKLDTDLCPKRFNC